MKLVYNFSNTYGHLDNKEIIELDEPEFIFEIDISDGDRLLTYNQLLDKYRDEAKRACIFKTLLEFSDYNTVT